MAARPAPCHAGAFTDGGCAGAAQQAVQKGKGCAIGVRGDRVRAQGDAAIVLFVSGRAPMVLSDLRAMRCERGIGVERGRTIWARPHRDA